MGPLETSACMAAKLAAFNAGEVRRAKAEPDWQPEMDARPKMHRVEVKVGLTEEERARIRERASKITKKMGRERRRRAEKAILENALRSIQENMVADGGMLTMEKLRELMGTTGPDWSSLELERNWNPARPLRWPEGDSR